jgi:hypothetical protein
MLLGNGEPKGGADSLLAFEADFTSQKKDDLLTESQAPGADIKSGAAIQPAHVTLFGSR